MFCSKWVVAVTAAVLILSGSGRADAGFIGLPSMLGQMAKRISFSNYTLAPMAFTQFCLRYANQCKPQPLVFRGGPVHLTQERWDELRTVNKSVNASIVPESNTAGLAGEKWSVNPSKGDCNDYAVSKRAELLKRGWPARTLLLSEVVTAWGEGHLVLVVRTSVGDLVLDNLTPHIRPWTRAPYRWVRMQTPKNPNFWASLASRSV
jgi:predicted transglutaminase-like cysteine proteinase